jgi:hypothetical protein
MCVPKLVQLANVLPKEGCVEQEADGSWVEVGRGMEAQSLVSAGRTLLLSAWAGISRRPRSVWMFPETKLLEDSGRQAGQACALLKCSVASAGKRRAWG